jgi:hypothetical protein
MSSCAGAASRFGDRLRRDQVLSGGGRGGAQRAYPDVRESQVSGEPYERWGAVAVAEFVPTSRHAVDSAMLAVRCHAALK